MALICKENQHLPCWERVPDDAYVELTLSTTCFPPSILAQECRVASTRQGVLTDSGSSFADTAWPHRYSGAVREPSTGH